MSNDISGFGIRVMLVASKTFPAGVVLSQFADDADPFDSPSIAIAGSAMGVNGDLVSWSIASPDLATVAVIPGSEDDKNLAVLFNANRVGRGKQSARDVITLTIMYPDGGQSTKTGGLITNGPAARSVASAGRIKTSAYQFAFEQST